MFWGHFSSIAEIIGVGLYLLLSLNYVNMVWPFGELNQVFKSNQYESIQALGLWLAPWSMSSPFAQCLIQYQHSINIC